MSTQVPSDPLLALRGLHTRDYLGLISVPELPPRTSPFDPGHDPVTLVSHLDQSAHLMSSLKISMACWIVADENASRRKGRREQAQVSRCDRWRTPRDRGGAKANSRLISTCARTWA